MARIASVEKLGRYETPIEVVNILATLARADGESTLIDPCCAEGVALSTLGKAWGCKTIGNEIDSLAAEKAKAVCDSVTCAPIEFLKVQGQVGALYLNPPYDVGKDKLRLELHFLMMATPWLKARGYLFLVVPDYILTNVNDQTVTQYLCSEYENLRVYRFPEPHYERFKQCVVIGRRRSASEPYYWREQDSFKNNVKQMPGLASGMFCLSLPYSTAMPSVETVIPNALETIEQAADRGPTTFEAFKALSIPKGLVTDFQPTMPCLPGHAAALVMDGKVDGTKVLDEETGHTLLLKGHSEKVMVQGETTVDDEGRTRREDRQKPVTVITSFDLDTLEIASLRSDKEPERFEAFLKAHQAPLINAVDGLYPPRFVPSRDMAQYLPELAKIHGPSKLPGHSENGLLPRQAECAAALAKLWETEQTGLVIGQMGSGKTCISLATQGITARGDWKLVVMSPGQTTQKWAREAEKVLQEFGVKATIAGGTDQPTYGPAREGWAFTNAPRSKEDRTPRAMQRVPKGKYKPGKTATITSWTNTLKGKKKSARGKPVLDVQRAFAEPNPSVIILSFETAKMGSRWEPAFLTKSRFMKWTETHEEEEERYYGSPRTTKVTGEFAKTIKVAVCPDCGAVLQDEEGGRPWPVEPDYEDENGKKFWRKAKRLCPKCQAPLWQDIGFDYGGRVALAEFISQHYAGQYNLIIDEAHNAKSKERDIGGAAMDLMVGCEHCLLLTGTIYDGKASGVAATLYRSLPEFREMYGFADLERFVEENGLYKEIHTTGKTNDRSTSSYGWRRTKENVRRDEIAGVTPAIISWILRVGVFIKKAHIAADLPPLTEYRVPVAVSDRLHPILDDLHRIHGDAVAEARQGHPSLLSQWVQASVAALNYAANDILGDHGIQGALLDSDDAEGEMLPKDAAIIERVKAELAAGRGVGIFFEQWERRPWHNRMKKLLEAEDIYCEVLSADACEKDDREEWYRGFISRCEAKKVKPVLLMSGSLSYEGMDFIELQTLINTSVDFRLARLLQRNERHHRLTQDQPCKCYYFYYEGTYEEAGLGAVAAKARAARKVDGDLIDGLAEMGMETEDLMVTLMRLAMADAKPMVVDWGDMQEVPRVEEEIASRPAMVIQPKPKVIAARGGRPALVSGAQLPLF